MNNDTIYALSSGRGKSGVAVIRISGDDLSGMARKFIGRDEIEPRRAYLTNMRDDAGELIDQCLILYFSGPRSFTGTDVIEIQCHGAHAVIQKIFDFLGAHQMRMAAPGEFSRRAFYNGKMDLADVDGLAALLDATTEQQRRMAIQSMMGGDSRAYTAWRQDMIEIAAYAAAMLDYADDDLPPNIGPTIREKTQKLYDEITNALSRYAAVRAVRGGFNIALVGDANVGKSSLFNCILGANRAIVSDTPGTTRDVVTATLDIDGFLVNISDTAGIRETTDAIEQMGIDRTRDTAQAADLIVHVGTDGDSFVPMANEIVVINKSDLSHGTRMDAIYTSAKTGDGMDILMSEIRRRMHAMMDGMESELVINARTHGLLTDAAENLRLAIGAGDNYDILAEHVRLAADDVGKILGAISAADVMDATFSQLCLGK